MYIEKHIGQSTYTYTNEIYNIKKKKYLKLTHKGKVTLNLKNYKKI